jgi:hypothetical protein
MPHFVKLALFLCLSFNPKFENFSKVFTTHQARVKSILIISKWSPLRQEPEAPYNNETQASEIKCTEAFRSNYPAKQRITRPPADYTAFLPRLKPGDSKPRD